MKRNSIAAPKDPYQAEYDASTLKRAAEIMSNRSRLTAAQKHAAKEAANLAKITSLKHPSPRPTRSKK